MPEGWAQYSSPRRVEWSIAGVVGDGGAGIQLLQAKKGATDNQLKSGGWVTVM